MPVLSPQVAKAEITSKRMLSSGRSVIISSSSVETPTRVEPRKATDTASRTVEEPIRRP